MYIFLCKKKKEKDLQLTIYWFQRLKRINWNYIIWKKLVSRFDGYDVETTEIEKEFSEFDFISFFFPTKFKLTNKSKEGFEDNEEADSKSS